MKKIIKNVFSAIYKVLSVFNLQFALLVLIVGVILYFCGVFEGGGIPLLIFCMLFICSILAAVIITIKKIFTSGKEKNKGSTLQIVKQPENQTAQIPTTQSFPQQQTTDRQPAYFYDQWQTPANQTQQTYTQNQTFAPTPQPNTTFIEQPRYFKVKQNPNYVMAEYSDRYELFLITPQGLKKVRVDQKK